MPNSFSASSKSILGAEKSLLPATALPTITAAATPALPKAVSVSRGQPPYEVNTTGAGNHAGPKKRLQETTVSLPVLYSVKRYSPHLTSPSKPSHTPPLPPLCYDHTADTWDKKASSSATELFYCFNVIKT